MKTRIAVFLGIAFCVFAACRKEEGGNGGLPQRVPVLPEDPYDYVSASHFPAWFLYPPLSFINSEPASNPTTDWGATLGRVLFYDTHLSANNTVSCGSCHKQERGFADVSAASTGFMGGHTDRNSMALVNTRFSFRYFWDLRANGLEQQVMMPVVNAVEMGTDTSLLPAELAQLSYYPSLFQKAFGTTQITNALISRALAQFVRSINSWNTRYDEGVHDNFASFTPLEKDGKDFYMSGQFACNHCHTTTNFYTTAPLNNGLESVFADSGFALVTGDPADIGKFKVPSLRNVALTAPYMHDGRFATLYDVVEHYNSAVQPSPTLDDRLTVEGTIGGTPRRFNMTEYQKLALVAFLGTLTDEPLISDPKYSDPFRVR